MARTRPTVGSRKIKVLKPKEGRSKPIDKLKLKKELERQLEQSSLAALTALPNSKSSFVKSFVERLSTKKANSII
jgi:hypothetical protein